MAEPTDNARAADDEVFSDENATSRLELLFGRERLARIQDSCILVFGIGGVGSNCIEALARGGVGHLVIIDYDTVTRSNINRQAVAYQSTVGQKKTDVMQRIIADINPDAEVITRDAKVLPDNLEELMDDLKQDGIAVAPSLDTDLRQVDFIIDAIDNVSAKLAIARYAQDHGIPIVSSMGAANRLYPERLKFADLYDTSICSLCRIMRKEGRKRGIKSLRVLYTDEPPIELGIQLEPSGPDPETGRRPKAPLGTASFFPPIMGQMIAADVIRSLAGMDDK